MRRDGQGDSQHDVRARAALTRCAWILAEKNKESTVLLDLDLHFGTVALNLDTDPGSGLCEALEQPSRIDATHPSQERGPLRCHVRPVAFARPRPFF